MAESTITPAKTLSTLQQLAATTMQLVDSQPIRAAVMRAE
jgi:hypothetical protein